MATDSQDDRNAPKRKALGKGLSALIPRQAPVAAVDSATGFANQASAGPQASREFVRVALDRVDPAPNQPRTHFDPDALRELAESIRAQGLLQPLVVREKNGRYELIAGERRWRASQLAGLGEVMAVVKDVSDATAFALALIENIQRADLNPLEEALAYQRLSQEFGMTQAELAGQVGKSRAAVANAVRLLSLPHSVQERVVRGELTAGHARALVVLDAESAEALAAQIVEDGLSVRDAEELVRAWKDGAPEEPQGLEESTQPSLTAQKAPMNAYRDDPQIRHVTERLQHALGARVKIKDRRGKGRLEIFYDDYDSLQGILERLVPEEL